MLKKAISGVMIILISVAILPQALKASITVEFGDVISGTIDSAGEIDTYIFSAVSNDTVFVRLSRVSGSLWPALILYSPNGTELSSDYGSDVAEVSCTLSESGEYTVNASDYWRDYTGNYSVFFQRINNPRNTVSIRFGETVSASIDPAGDVDTYVFQAEAGETVLIRASQISGSFWPELRLYSLNGTELKSDYGYDVAEIYSILVEVGNYTILVNDYWGDYTGNYSIFVQRLNNPAKATPIGFGDTVSGSIDTAGYVDTYSFSAAAGDAVLMRVSQVSGSLWCEVRLYSPNGTELMSGSSYNVAEINYTLTENGNYTVLIHDYWGDYTGDYSIFVQRLNNPGNDVSIFFGEIILASIDPAGDVDTYVFQAEAGETVLIRASQISGLLYPEVRLYAPNGTELERDWDWGVAEFTSILTEDGDYTVLLCNCFGEYVGNYTLYLSEVVFEELTLGIPYVGNISTNEWHSFYISVEANKNLLLTMETASQNGILELYGSYAEIPTRSDYDCFVRTRNVLGNCELLISPTENGTYYFGVNGKDVEGLLNYTITALIVERHVSNVYPRILTNSTRATAHISGIGFTSRMWVELRDGDAVNISAETVVFSSCKMVIAHFDLSNASLGIYNLAVIWPDGQEKMVQAAVEVKELQEGSLYSLPDLQMDEGAIFTFDIGISGISNLFITLQKTTLVSYGGSWSSELSLMYEGIEVASTSGSHDLILHIADPNPGVYTVTITAHQAGSGILNVWVSLPELPLGEWIVGTIYTSYGSIWYQVEVPLEQDSLCFEAEAMGAWSHFDIYYEEYGSPNHWVSRQGPQTSIEIPAPDPGRYIVEFMDSAMLYKYGDWAEDQTRDVLLRADTAFIVESLPHYQPIITSISPERGGNTGLVTVEIKGGWLDPNATISMMHSEYLDINPLSVCGSLSKTTLTATFNLTNKEPGEWNLCVTNPDGESITDLWSFTIEEGGQPELWVEIIGRERMRVGSEQKLIVRYGNSGEIDAEYPYLALGIPAELEYMLDIPWTSPSSSSTLDSSTGEIEVTLINLPKLPPGSVEEITFGAKATDEQRFIINADISLDPSAYYSSLISGVNSLYPILTDLIDVSMTESSGTEAIINGEQVEYWGDDPPAGYVLFWCQFPHDGSKWAHVAKSIGGGQFIQMFNDGITMKNVRDYNDPDEHGYMGALKPKWWSSSDEDRVKKMADVIKNWESEYTQTICQHEFSMGKITTNCAGLVWLLNPEFQSAGCFSFDSMYDKIMKDYGLSKRWDEQLQKRGLSLTGKEAQARAQECPVDWYKRLLEGAQKIIESIMAHTPEDKYGPSGFDTLDTSFEDRKRFVPADQSFYYRIDFWNKENATAPACDVFVKDQLDTDLDWSSFRFEEIGFLNWTVKLELCQYFNVYVDTRPHENLIVNVEGAFNPSTSEISWTFRSLDPATMEKPEDPMAGFLPPITESGYEVGWVCFSVDPKVDLATGTRIENQAFVNFDGVGPYNPAPKEGPYINTIDSAAPTSLVKPLPETQTSSSFLLEWEGNDGDGSGIRDFTIYVSEDGENFVPLLEHVTETSTIFNGTQGHTYYFFACARDNVGNEESISYELEATTIISLSSSDDGFPQPVIYIAVVVTIIAIGLVSTGLIYRKRKARKATETMK